MVMMIIYFTFMFIYLERNIALLYALIIYFLIIILFSTLTTSVNDNELEIKFGIGIIHKSFLINEIETLKKIKTKWYDGWGIRLTPAGWLYNISGFDAIEIKMKNGKIHKIGTNEIDKFENAINEAMKNNNRGI
jgi:hypothetical protein